MKKIWCIVSVLMLIGFASSVNASVLVFSPNGQYTVKSTLSDAASASDVANKAVHVTSSVTINSLTWPSDRALIVDEGGAIFVNAGETLTINGRFSAKGYVFTGPGTIVFGPGAIFSEILEWYGDVAGAISKIGSTRKTTLDVTSTQKITTNTVSPANISFRKTPLGFMNVSSSRTLTINGKFDLDKKKFFGGTGTVKFARSSTPEVHPEWWTDNDSPGTTDMTTALDLAVKSILDVGGIIHLDNYLITSGKTYNHQYDIKFIGDGWNNTNITHTSNDTALTFQRTGTNLFARIMFDGFRVTGNSGVLAQWAQIQDSVGSGAHNCYITGYSAGSAFHLHNYAGWTEYADFDNLILRGNLHAFTFSRDSTGGGTASFNLFTARRINAQMGVGGANVFNLVGSSGNEIVLYGADIDVTTFFEVGGSHAVFVVPSYTSFVESRVLIRDDGIPIIDGSDSQVFLQSGTGHIDVVGDTVVQQSGVGININAVTTGSSLTAMWAIVHQGAVFDFNQAGPTVRCKGAKVIWYDAAATTDRTIHISNLPALSTFRLTLTVTGTNTNKSTQYIINNYDYNAISGVNKIGGVGMTNFLARTYLGGADGTFSANNGGQFDVVLNAATQGSTQYVKFELEML